MKSVYYTGLRLINVTQLFSKAKSYSINYWKNYAIILAIYELTTKNKHDLMVHQS